MRVPEKITPETVQIPDFGKARIIPVINAVGCVDPRESKVFPKDESESIKPWDNIKRVPHHEGAERSPGGSLGKAMSLLASVARISPEDAVDLVNKWEKSEERKFTYHQDDHGKGLGCGHVDTASQKENEGLYGIPSGKVIKMRKYLSDKLSRREMKAEVPVLIGHHREVGVVVVLTDEKAPKTVRATDDKGNEFFRFDATRHDKSLERLAKFAQKKGIKVTAEALKASAEKQRNATFMLLGAGLPIYEVDLRGKTPTVTPKGPVEQIPKELKLH